MLPVILVIAAVAVAAPLVIAATKPDTFRVERRAKVKAPPAKIFPLISDFHRWNVWSPWEKLDPDLRRSHSGSPSGKGAVYEWEGNKKVGKGRMEILSTVPDSQVTIKLDFIAPWEAHNTTVFSLQPDGDATTIVWAMTGENPFMNKVMSVFMNFDKLIGNDFEKGLAQIKLAAES